MTCDWRAPDEDLFLDKLSIEEAPTAVVLNPITEATVSTLRLAWTAAAILNFKEYRVYRSETPTVTEASTLVTTITNPSVTNFTDAGLMSRKTYYYKVYLYNTNDTGNESNQASAMTLGVPPGWTEDFETNQPAWTFTGLWSRMNGVGRNGGTALVDSPADYGNSTDTAAQFAVNLIGTSWPVLRFWDRYTMANGDFGRLEVSINAGASWQLVYGVAATRADWVEQSVDLSRWKNYSQVWIRFRVFTDGSVPADGWYLEDVSLVENTTPAVGQPFFDSFENGLALWQHAGWTLSTNQPYAGGFTVQDTPEGRMPTETELALNLASSIVLTNAVNPQLTFWVRGVINPYAWLRAQVSADGGINWTDLSAGNVDYPFNATWTRKQISLAAYTNQTIRLRFYTACDWRAPEEDLFLDNIGVGEPAPGAPSLVSPVPLSSVTVVRPLLVVSNAIDYQSDPLSYRFEVYADVGLSNLVAQVPLVASGSDTTAWQVDTDLPNNQQYWWRCRATDSSNAGPWMATATFFVNETNHPPTTPLIAGPPNGTLVTNLNELLSWFPVIDPDEGDDVAGYQLQVAAEPAFLAPLINATNLPAVTGPAGTNWTIAVALGDLPGAGNLTPGTVCYWRVGAFDLRGLSSDWSPGLHAFQFGIAPPQAGTITALHRQDNGQLTMEWTGAAGLIFVEFSHTLNPPLWFTVAGPLPGTNWTFAPVPGTPSGFYRLRSE